MNLLAIVYRIFPELHKVVLAWEIRCAAVVIGLDLLYILIRFRLERLSADNSLRRAVRVGFEVAIRVLIGVVPMWLLWCVIDPVCAEMDRVDMWQKAGERQLLFLFLGWTAWSTLIGELLFAIFRYAARLIQRPLPTH